ncbi:MAG: HlyD family efflux transporter periplasmic adaptor subunit [Myxococcales bacterium]|nr:HlyD family efflux transporter periplasmic adaptor subunit [Myxococcales bacterium]
MSRMLSRSLGLAVLLGLAACRPEAPAAAAASTHAAPRITEDELSTLHLEPDSIEAIGLQIAPVTQVHEQSTRDVGGVVVIPPGRALAVTAPLSGTLSPRDPTLEAGAPVTAGQVLVQLVPFAPADRDVQAQARRQHEIAHARLELVRARLERTRTLVEQRGAAQRTLEETQAEVATAEAEEQAAAARVRMLRRSPLAADATLPIVAPSDGILRTISAAPGQRVAAGSPLFEVVRTAGPWVRVPVYPGERARLDLEAPVRVARLGQDPMQGVEARPVLAPPSADPIGLTVDLFYGLPSTADGPSPDERVVVRLRYADQGELAAVPASAVVLDFDGGSWVYEQLDATSFRRRRIEIVQQDQELAVLRRGPPVGTPIVAVGALELLGAELGVSH